MTTRTERDEAAQTWAETPRWGRHSLAEAAGWEPHPDDLLPAQPLDPTDPWAIALAASIAEAQRLKETA